MADDVDVKFGASIEGLIAGLRGISSQVEESLSPLTEMQEALSGIGEAMIAAFAVEKIVDFVKEVAELGEQAERTAEMLGLTVEQVTDLQYAATVTGGSSQGMTRALEQLEKAMSDVHNTSSIQYAAFQSLGISTDFLKDHQNDLIGVLEAISQKFSESADGPAKTAIAMALLGRAGAEMVPLLNEGAEGFAELKKQAEAAGVELNDSAASGMAATAEANNKLGQATQGLGEILFQIFEPGINATVTALTNWIEELTQSLSSSTVLQGAVEDLAFAFDGVVAVVEILITAFQELWTVGEGIINGLGKGLTAIAAAMHDAVTLNWSQVGADLNNGWQQQVDNAKATVQSMADLANQMEDNLTKMFKAQVSGNALAANSSGSPDDRDKPTLTPPGQNLHSGSGATDALDAERAKIDGEVRIDQEGLSRKQSILDAELKNKQISEQEWVTESEAAVNAEYQAELALLQKELGLSGLKLTQRQELLNKIEELEQKHATAITKIQQKAAADSAAAWKQVTDTISSAVNSQIGSLLQGTETIGQAVENVGLSLATSALENALKSLLASAAQTFGGIFAFLAPTMGPAAAGPAAAGEATVMAAASGLSSLDVGTWGLPSDGPIMAHAGETVIPAFESGQFRDAIAALAGGGAGGKGGHTVHFHGPVMDKIGLAKIVGEVFSSNPSLRPKY